LTTTYARRLGPFSGTLLVVAGIIGSGIFLNPAVVAQRVGSGPLTMLAWGLGAVIAILGAFIFAELGARAPAAGGGYAYLRDAFGPLPAFLYGWALITAIASGAIAAVAVTFANYAVPLLGIPAGSERVLAIGTITFFAVVNMLGITRYSQANREAIERLNKLWLSDLSVEFETFDAWLNPQRAPSFERLDEVVSITLRTKGEQWKYADVWLADGTVHFMGQPVAVVVAREMLYAREAARKARVAVQELPAILSIDEAMAHQSFVMPAKLITRGKPAEAIAASLEHLPKF